MSNNEGVENCAMKRATREGELEMGAKRGRRGESRCSRSASQ